jgi:hypothetical protein
VLEQPALRQLVRDVVNLKGPLTALNFLGVADDIRLRVEGSLLRRDSGLLLIAINYNHCPVTGTVAVRAGSEAAFDPMRKQPVALTRHDGVVSIPLELPAVGSPVPVGSRFEARRVGAILSWWASR